VKLVLFPVYNKRSTYLLECTFNHLPIKRIRVYSELMSEFEKYLSVRRDFGHAVPLVVFVDASDIVGYTI
jgi:hypothetical protein